MYAINDISSFLQMCAVVLYFNLTHKKMSRYTVRLFAEIKMCSLALLKNSLPATLFHFAYVLMMNLKPNRLFGKSLLGPVVVNRRLTN